MTELIHKIEKRVNGIIFTLIGNGVLMLAFSILIIWTDYFLRILVGLIVISIAYVFFYAAYRLASIKKEIKKFII